MGFDLFRALDDIGKAAGSVVEDVAEAVTDVAEDVAEWGEQAVEDVAEWGEQAVEDVAEWGEQAGEDVVKWVEQAGEDILAAGEDVIEVITGIVKTGAEGVLDIIEDARGLVPTAEVLQVDIRPGAFWAALGPMASVQLVPGEATPVTVALPALPPNADVKRIRATLTVSVDTTPGSPETLDAVVNSYPPQASGTVTQTIGTVVTPPPVPRNVRVALQGGEAFWSHDGTLPPGDHELPDFAPAANAYLDAARMPPGAGMALVFMVTSETPGRVDVAIVPDSLEYSVLQTQTWLNLLDGTLRIDRNLQLDFGTVARFPLDPLVSSVSGSLGLTGVRVDVSGEVGPERLLGNVPAHDGRQFATVSPDYGVAQALLVAAGAGFTAGANVTVAGLSALLEVDAGGAELYVELRRDAGGAPGSDAPLGGVNFEVAPPDGATGPAWVYAALPEPVPVAVDTPHWIVLRAIRGAARLAAAPGSGSYLGGLLVNRGGQLWKPFAPGAAPGPAALVRLAYLPEPDRQTAALALAVEGLPPLRPEVAAQPQRLTLPVPGGQQPRTLVLTSHARGATTLSNLVQEFAQGAEGG
jgi:hypothetical protein